MKTPEITDLTQIVPNRYQLVRAVAKRAEAIERHRRSRLDQRSSSVLQALREIYDGTTQVVLPDADGKTTAPVLGKGQLKLPDEEE